MYDEWHTDQAKHSAVLRAGGSQILGHLSRIDKIRLPKPQFATPPLTKIR